MFNMLNSVMIKNVNVIVLNIFIKVMFVINSVVVKIKIKINLNIISIFLCYLLWICSFYVNFIKKLIIWLI